MASERLFIAYLTSGLGNRIRPLASAMAYASVTGRKLKVYWDNITPNGCLARLDQLFQQGFDELTLDEILAYMDDHVGVYSEKSASHGVEREAIRHGRDQLLTLAKRHGALRCDALQKDDPHRVVIVYDNDFLACIERSESIRHLRSLLPHDAIIQNVRKLCDRLGLHSQLKSVHARGTDFGLQNAVELYEGLIRTHIHVDRGEKFFLSTDDANIEKALLSLFGDQLITRDGRLHLELNEGKDSWFDPDSFTISDQHGIDALTDIYLLSCTHLVVYHPGSTFAEVARCLHNVLEIQSMNEVSLNTAQLNQDFCESACRLLPRHHEALHHWINHAGAHGPIHLEDAGAEFMYFESLGFQVPIMERMFFSATQESQLKWDADLFSSLAAIPRSVFPYEVFGRLCPYPEALSQLQSIHPLLQGKRVLVIGSETFWVELFCAISAASSITTVEYREIVWEGSHGQTPEKLRTLTWEDYHQHLDQHAGQYDVVIAYSSIEHSGLGRYGDRLMPMGDLYTFKCMSSSMSPQGICMVAVPVGKDLTHFNAHRIYGEHRIGALCHVSGMHYLGMVSPQEDYLTHHEQDAALREGWNLPRLANLPAGQYRQPLLCFSYDKDVLQTGQKQGFTVMNDWKPDPAFLNDPRSLSSLHVRFDTDKGTSHTYVPFYDELFGAFRDEAINFLEIGCLSGGSLKLFETYFTQATIFGLDNWAQSTNGVVSGFLSEGRSIADIKADIEANYKRIRLMDCDSTRKDLAAMVIGDHRFDFIIDDGDHSPLAQRTTFINFIEYLKPGGVYIVEDVFEKGVAHLIAEAAQEMGLNCRIEMYPFHKDDRLDDVLIVVYKA